MRIKTAVLVAVVLLVWSSKSVWAGDILYQENFNSGDGGWDGHSQGWNVDTNPANGINNSPAYHYGWYTGIEEDSFAVLPGKNWQDISLEAKVKATTGNIGIGIRMSVNDISLFAPQVGGYRLVMVPGELRFQRYRLIQPSGMIGDHKNPFNLATKSFNFNYNHWYTLKVEARGTNFKCYVDGNLEIEFNDTTLMTDYELERGITHPAGAVFPQGTIGFVEYKSTVWWDEVKVENLASDCALGARGDLNCDSEINQTDLNILKTQWRTNGSGDLNGDSLVDEKDLSVLLSFWTAVGPLPTPSILTPTPGGQARVYTEWRQENWFGSWKWVGNLRKLTTPEADSLIIHWPNQPFEVVFWDGRDGGTKMPHWRPVNDIFFGVCPIWFESGNNPDWEPLFTDRSLIKLEVLEERSDFVRVRWWYKPTKDRQSPYYGNGLQVHRGNTEVEQIFDFYANGLTEIKMNIKLGNQDFNAQSGNDLELSEWNFLFPSNLTPINVIGREGKILKAMDPYSSAETSMDLSGWSLDKNLANSWLGQIQILYRKNPGTDFFAIWGKKYQPTSPDLYQRVDELYYQRFGVGNKWPKPSCNISAPLNTRAYMPSASYVANLEYKWLIGMGAVENLDLRKIARDWLDQGIIAIP